MIRQGADLIVNISASPFYVGKKEFRQHMLGSIARKYGVALIYANQVGGNDSVLFDGVSCAFDQNGNLVARTKEFKEDLAVYDTDTKQRGNP
jgi:predicted amidohydrolase